MSKILRTAAVAIGLSLSFASGSVHARPINYQHHRFHHGYAYSSPASVGPWEFVPGRGIIGGSCDLPSGACSNDERVTG